MSKVILERDIAGRVMRLVQGDITLAETDAIVNAANSHLQHGGGVAGAIARRGGPEIQRQSDAIGFCPEGEAAVTGAGKLAAGHVIHAVGPKGDDPQGDEKLASAVRNALLRAEELGLRSISLPAVSSGIFGFPKDRCARILFETTEDFLATRPGTSLEQVDLVLFDDETLTAFAREWRERWEG